MKNSRRLWQVALVALVVSSCLLLRADPKRGTDQNSPVSGGLPPTPNAGGWYTPDQAAKGAKSYQKTCANCHGPSYRALPALRW
jgi:mono/diheme cytochrome c family protein